MPAPILSKELADQIERSEIDYMIDRMLAIQERPGNPMGVEIRHFGGAVAFYCKEMPWPQFNTIKGISVGELDKLDEMLDFYQSKQSKFQVEIVPAQAQKELFKALNERKLYQSDFHASLYCFPERIESSNDALVIHEILEDEFDIYAEIHCLGTGLPISGKDYIAANNRVLFNRPGWKFFIASYKGHPAGVGVLFMKEGIASLTFAATLPLNRGKGIQRALIERRVAEAFENHCHLIVSQTKYASTSYRNMERTGMRLGYTRVTWTKESF